MHAKRDPYHLPIGDDLRLFEDSPMNVVSDTGTTGSVPTPPTDGGEADAYGELGGLPLPDLPVTEPLPGAPVRITGRRAKRR